MSLTRLLFRCVKESKDCKLQITVPFTDIWNHELLGTYLREHDWLVLLASKAGEAEVSFEAICRPCAQILSPETEEFLAGSKTPVE